jgi:Tfp pilus assembly protein PilF
VAYSYLNQGELAKALTLLQSVTQQSPDYAEAYYQLALAYH